MSKASDEFAKRLNMAAKNKGLTTPAEICKITGQNRITVGSYMRGERLASIEACIALAKALDVSPMWLYSGKSGGDIDNLVRGQKRTADYSVNQDNKMTGNANLLIGSDYQQSTTPIHSGRRIPLYSSALAGPGGSISIGATIMERIEAPSQLADVADAYAVRVAGESMEPRYFPGEIVYVHPTMTIRRGDFVVAQISENGAEGGIQAYVKRFVSIDDSKLVLEQYNPSKTIKFPRDNFMQTHRIIASSS
jgi:phage repressor protein C with HTH and peptisase S24 domain